MWTNIITLGRTILIEFILKGNMTSIDKVSAKRWNIFLLHFLSHYKLLQPWKIYKHKLKFCLCYIFFLHLLLSKMCWTDGKSSRVVGRSMVGSCMWGWRGMGWGTTLIGYIRLETGDWVGMVRHYLDTTVR